MKSWGVVRIYSRLRKNYGAQAWWPAQSRFEIMVGAVLTQNTAWTNVEHAIGNLKTAGALTPAKIVDLPIQTLAGLLRPSGCYNVKSKRLRSLCRWLLDQGGHTRLDRVATPQLRASLLAVHGIGPETADAILLYAFTRPVFVVDAYTRRLFSRVGRIDGDESYAEIQCLFESKMKPEAADFNEYHALIVAHGKAVCRSTPRCKQCCLRPGCLHRPAWDRKEGQI